MFGTRSPAVAGRFYPGEAGALAREVAGYLDTGATPRPALGVLAPHAGYLYSGAIAGAAYAEVVVPRRAIVLCPNHTGMGSRRALWPSGAFKLPGYEIPVDVELASQVQEAARLEPDFLAHQHEHALEVQLPFLYARNPELRIVPICLASLSARECVEVGEGLAKAIGDRKGEVLLVASSDMSHYISAADARRLDELALARVLALDPEGLYQTVEENDITMCGYLPATAMLAAARALGARSARLVRYGNSGELSGDLEKVVGYAGVVVDA